ncbi:MAG: HD domain-containing protein [Thermoanaerobaculales bacterium]|jgi:HD-GYP domain-containing protein (c-di-GMP phosphodiesterase class II)/HAMP domain-containing protein|nr:HD domain-containing protein [Thermoanaerobaculales bacterium]
MAIDRRLFRSRLAHRMFVAYVLCALVPMVLIGVASYRSVTNELVDQASARIHQASKALGLSLYERLLFAEVELAGISRSLQLEPDTGLDALGGERLARVAIVGDGAAATAPAPNGAEDEFRHRQREVHLLAGRSILLPIDVGGGAPAIRIARRVDPEDPESALLVGEVSPSYLWGLDGGNSVPADAEFCVFDETGGLIFGSFDGCVDAWTGVNADHHVAADRETGAIFPVESLRGDLFVGGHRDLFLEARFLASGWVVTVCEPYRSVVAPLARWRVVYPALVLLVSWMVLLVIIAAIRRNLDPIDRLREATEHLGQRDFKVSVDIRSGDEFEQLADAFNEMSSRLRRQFGALNASANVHRAVLASFDVAEVVDAAVKGIHDYFECSLASVAVVDGDGARSSRTTFGDSDAEPVREACPTPGPDLRSQLERLHPGSVIGQDVAAPGALVALLGLGAMDTVAAVPIRVRGELRAVIGFGHRDRRPPIDDDLEHLTQLADQVAVALSNIRMLEEVNSFSVGSLAALARAVDAKSPWTAGHSERVTRLAVMIGEAYGLDSFELARLYRGSMLHDIGKLGISQSLLDKKARLDHDEFEIIRSHTLIGERILEPLPAIGEIMPVIAQHHERYDGSGYPNGLIGAEIDVKARILAVADVYDAMTNPRPYRDSVDPMEVVGMIREQAGSEFDPKVVDAFLRVIDARGGIENLEILKQDFSFFRRPAAEHGVGWGEAQGRERR